MEAHQENSHHETNAPTTKPFPTRPQSDEHVGVEAPPDGDTTVVTNTIATFNVQVDDSNSFGEGMSIGDGIDVENGVHIGDGIDTKVDAGSRKLLTHA